MVIGEFDAKANMQTFYTVFQEDQCTSAYSSCILIQPLSGPTKDKRHKHACTHKHTHTKSREEINTQAMVRLISVQPIKWI